MTRRSRHRNKKGNQGWLAWTLAALFLLLIIRGAAGLMSRAAEEPDRVASGVTHYPDLEITRATSGPEWPLTRYEGFTVCFDERRHNPVWVGWELLESETDGTEARSNRFWQDDDVYGCASPRDYTNSGYDRGHMCPAADQKWSKQAMRDCFSMANITPQVHDLNGGAWKTLEQKERQWAQRDSALVIVSGPIYGKSPPPMTIGTTGVHVPEAFFKVLLAPYLDKPRAIGFIYPNMNCPGNMRDYSMSVDEVEAATGLDFFSNLPDEIEEEAERAASFDTWNR